MGTMPLPPSVSRDLSEPEADLVGMPVGSIAGAVVGFRPVAGALATAHSGDDVFGDLTLAVSVDPQNLLPSPQNKGATDGDPTLHHNGGKDESSPINSMSTSKGDPTHAYCLSSHHFPGCFVVCL